MPSRIIRESCRTSPNLNQLSDGGERLFWRLTTVCDDYGRFDADPRVLFALCFPLKVGDWTVEKITILRDELVTQNLILLYEIEQHLYGHFLSWNKWQRHRKTHPKFPEPPKSAATGGKLPQPAAVVMGYRVLGMEKGVLSNTGAPAPATSNNHETKERLKTFMAYLTHKLSKCTGSPQPAAVRQIYGRVIGYLKSHPGEIEAVSREIDLLPTQFDGGGTPTADWYVAAIGVVIQRRQHEEIKRDGRQNPVRRGNDDAFSG